jgi:hypothetical protein
MVKDSVAIVIDYNLVLYAEKRIMGLISVEA